MQLSLFLKVKAVVSIVFGLGLLLIPTTVMGWSAVSLDSAGTVMTRTVGALLTGIAVLCWLASSAPPSEGRRAAVTGLFVADTLGFVVELAAQLGGLMNALGWLFVALWFLLALGLGYFRFVVKA